jgi:hypothetical protein
LKVVSSSGSSIDDALTSEGDVKEVQGHAISVYGNVAVMARCPGSTLMFRNDGRWWK